MLEGGNLEHSTSRGKDINRRPTHPQMALSANDAGYGIALRVSPHPPTPIVSKLSGEASWLPEVTPYGKHLKVDFAKAAAEGCWVGRTHKSRALPNVSMSEHSMLEDLFDPLYGRIVSMTATATANVLLQPPSSTERHASLFRHHIFLLPSAVIQMNGDSQQPGKRQRIHAK